MGATAGRTTLNGEGLQHEDGHSHRAGLHGADICVAYDPAMAFELAAIIRDGIRRMYEDAKEDIFYYITLYNDNYPMLPMPDGCGRGHPQGPVQAAAGSPASPRERGVRGPQAHLFGSGPILPHALRAQELLAEHFGVAADVWSATSYKELRREALEVERWNLLHPTEKPRQSYVQTVLAKEEGVFVAASDFMRALPEMIARWVPGGLFPLGTDGFGRSETRAALRRHFEVDAECITVAALSPAGAARPDQAGRGATGDPEIRHQPGKDQPDASYSV